MRWNILGHVEKKNASEIINFFVYVKSLVFKVRKEFRYEKAAESNGVSAERMIYQRLSDRRSENFVVEIKSSSQGSKDPDVLL